jgi:hypothetical protein
VFGCVCSYIDLVPALQQRAHLSSAKQTAIVPTFSGAAAARRYIRRYFSKVQGFSIRQLLPGSHVLLACCLVSSCLAASNATFMAPQQLALHGFWRQAALHVGVGVCCLALLLMRIVKAERATISQVSGLRQKQE